MYKVSYLPFTGSTGIVYHANDDTNVFALELMRVAGFVSSLNIISKDY